MALVGESFWLVVLVMAGTIGLALVKISRGNSANHGLAFIADDISLLGANNTIQATAALWFAEI
jgi:hypothetical protein